MKSFAKFLTGITVVIVALIAYYIYSSTLPLQMTVEVTSAAEKTEAFEKVAAAVLKGEYENVSSLQSAENYYFVTLSVSAKNFSPFPAEWAQFVPKPHEGDVLVVSSDAGPKDIDRFKEDDFTITLLTSSSDNARTGWLEYYIFGRFHSVEGVPNA